MVSIISTWGILLSLVCSLVLFVLSQKKKNGNLPPGPKGIPVLGNVKDMPPPGVPEFEHWQHHKKLYGPVSSVTIMGQTLVLIHGRKEAHELLEKTSMKTSDRPRAPFVSDMCGYENTVVGQRYDKRFRRYRKLLHQELGTKVKAARYQELQEQEARRQLVRTLDRPDQLHEHFKTTTGATILQLAYGYTIESQKTDPLVSLNEIVMQQFVMAVAPMSWAVDLFPVLRYLPDGFPGATFKEKSREWKKCLNTIVHTPYRYVESQMQKGNHKESYVSKLLEPTKAAGGSVTLTPEEEHDIVWTAGSLYAAGVDTQSLTLISFTLAMIRFPEVQRKAQEEMDRVIGTDRLPSFDDRDSLPFMNALLLETLRWWAVLPLGIPHVVTESFDYEGMHFPKGAYLFANIWSLLRDPEVYSSPDKFDPDRYLAPRNEPDPSGEAFGYGRRICPGRLLAESTLWINIATLLATYDIKHALDKDGKEISVDHVRPTPGTTNLPSDFKFRVVPRNKEREEMVTKYKEKHPWTTSDADKLKMTAK